MSVARKTRSRASGHPSASAHKRGRTSTPSPADDVARLAMIASIVEHSDDAIIARDLDGIVTSWNQGASRLYGYTSAEALGKHIRFIVPDDRIAEIAHIEERIRQGETIKQFDTVRMSVDGRRIDVSLSVSPIWNANGDIVGAASVTRDTTEQVSSRSMLRTLRATLDNRAVVLAAARNVALDILASQTGVEALRHIADAARTLSHARYAALGVARQDGPGLLEFVTVGLTGAEEAAIGPRPRGEGILGLLLKRTEPLRIANMEEHPAAVGFPARHPKMHTFLGVPIRRGDACLGSLYLTEKEGGGQFTEEDAQAVEALGDYAAVAIHNLRMLLQQRALVSGLIAAQEEERRAVAYDLHDGLTQYVMASHAHMEAFRAASAAGEPAKAERELEQSCKYMQEAVVESRRLVNGLRSLALDDLGLAGATEQLLAEERQRAGWQSAEFVQNIGGRRFDRALETAAYRVTQEAITNARKHADATTVRVTFRVADDERTGAERLELEVTDWGRGFIADDKVREPGHFGLQGMAERVNLLGGAYELHSAPDAGTTVRATLPVAEPARTARGGEYDGGTVV